jgi:amidase
MFERQLATPEGARQYLDLLFWISFATLTGLPATTAPVGLTRDGLPVGIQIMGPTSRMRRRSTWPAGSPT